MATKKQRSKVSRAKPDSFRRIPKLRSCKKDLLEPVHEQDRRALTQLINNSHLLAGSEHDLDITHIEMVQNDRLLEKFWEKKEDMMIDLGMGGKRALSEAFAYVTRKNITESCSDGLKVDPSQPNILGNSLMGLHLFKHLDMCIQSYRKTASPTNRFQVIMCKILLGRAKSVPVQKHGGLPLEPTPDYHNHVCCHSAKPTDSMDQAIDNSQVYLYEYDDDGIPAKSPGHCLPYAVITARYRRGSKPTNEKTRCERNRIATVKPYLATNTRNQLAPKENESPDLRQDAKRDTTSVDASTEICRQVSSEQKRTNTPYNLAAYQAAQTALTTNPLTPSWPYYWNQDPYHYWPTPATGYLPPNPKDPRTAYKASCCAPAQAQATNVGYPLPLHAIQYDSIQAPGTDMVYSMPSQEMYHRSLEALATNAVHHMPTHPLQGSFQTPYTGMVHSIPTHPLEGSLPTPSTGAVHSIPTHATQQIGADPRNNLTAPAAPSAGNAEVPSLYNAFVFSSRKDNPVHHTGLDNMKDGSRENPYSQKPTRDNSNHMTNSHNPDTSNKNKQTTKERENKQQPINKDKSSDKMPVTWILKPIDILCIDRQKSGSRNASPSTSKTLETTNDTNRKLKDSEIKSKDSIINEKHDRDHIGDQKVSCKSKPNPSEILKPTSKPPLQNTRDQKNRNVKHRNVKYSNLHITADEVSQSAMQHNPDQTSDLMSRSNKCQENKDYDNGDSVKKKSVVQHMLDNIAKSRGNLRKLKPLKKETSKSLSRPSVYFENNNRKKQSNSKNCLGNTAVPKQIELLREEFVSVQEDQNHNKLSDIPECSVEEKDMKDASLRNIQTEDKQEIKAAKLEPSVAGSNNSQSDVCALFSQKRVQHKSVSAESVLADAKKKDNRRSDRKVTRVVNASRSGNKEKSFKPKQLQEYESGNCRQQYVNEGSKDGGNKLSHSSGQKMINNRSVSSVTNDKDGGWPDGQLRSIPPSKHNKVNYEDALKSREPKEPLRSYKAGENSIEQSIFEAVYRLANFDKKENAKEENALFNYDDETSLDNCDESHHSGIDGVKGIISEPDKDGQTGMLELSDNINYDKTKKNSTESQPDLGNKNEENATNKKSSLASFWKKIQNMYNISFRGVSANGSDSLVGSNSSRNSQSLIPGAKSQDCQVKSQNSSIDVSSRMNGTNAKSKKINVKKRNGTDGHGNENLKTIGNSSTNSQTDIRVTGKEEDTVSTEKSLNGPDTVRKDRSDQNIDYSPTQHRSEGSAFNDIDAEIDSRRCASFYRCSVTSGPECNWPVIEDTDQNEINDGFSIPNHNYYEDNRSYHWPSDEDNGDHQSIPDHCNQSENESEISDRKFDQRREKNVVEIWSSYCYPPIKIKVPRDSVITIETFCQFDRKVFAMYNDFKSKYKKWCRLMRSSNQNNDGNSEKTALDKQIKELEFKLACLHTNIESCVVFIESQMPQCERPVSLWQQTNLAVISRHIEVIENTQPLDDLSESIRRKRLQDLIVQTEWVKGVDIVPKLPLDSPGNNLESLFPAMQNDKKILSLMYLTKKLRILSKLKQRQENRTFIQK